jgi:hypothetical protein
LLVLIHEGCTPVLPPAVSPHTKLSLLFYESKLLLGSSLICQMFIWMFEANNGLSIEKKTITNCPRKGVQQTAGLTGNPKQWSLIFDAMVL